MAVRRGGIIVDISVGSLAVLAHRNESCEATCRRSGEMCLMIVCSRYRAFPRTPEAAPPRREQRGEHAAAKLPGVIAEPQSSGQHRHGQSIVTRVRFQCPTPTSGLRPEALTVWTHGKGRSPTMTVTGARPAGPPLSSPEQAAPLFSGQCHLKTWE